MLQSALQRIIVLTIIFGKSLWESIDIFGNYVIDQFHFFNIDQSNIDISMWLISIYILIHLIAGVFVGIYSARIPGWVKEEMESGKDFSISINDYIELKSKHRKRKKKWFLKPSGIFIILLALSIVVLTYVFPQFEDSQGKMAIVMIVRSIVIMLFWYIVVGPLLRKMYNRYLSKKKSKYAIEVEQSIRFMPMLKELVVYCWKISKNQPGLKRYKYFITLLIVSLFTVKLPVE
jgi:MFS family permease